MPQPPAPSPLDATALSRFAQAVRHLCPMSDEDLQALTNISQWTTLGKGQSLLRAGDQARQVGFVLEGGLREYYVLEDGQERTKGFSLPDWFAGSLSDLISGDVSKVWIVAEAPSVLMTTPWAAYRALTDTHPAWGRFARHMAEALYMIKVQREYELLAMDAAQRYQAALQRWPTLEAVFSQKDIASYVGVTPVHLSRLRTAMAATPPGSQNLPAR